MLSNVRRALIFSIPTIGILGICSIALQAASPKGWFVAGNRPASYESGVDDLATHYGHPSAYLKATQPTVDGFGTLMQSFRADHYLGRRVRFSAFLKTERAQRWAGLWMRVDKGAKWVAFDNMHDKPIMGTSHWQECAIALDVPHDATGISFGVLLDGGGTVWLNNAKFDIVGPDVLTTNGDVIQTPDEPTNLDFEKSR